MSGNSCIFVAVHAGAGNHAEENEGMYKSVCKVACQQAMLLLQGNQSALEAVKIAVKFLEDDKNTNAGKGSNMTMEGSVECDASAMDGSSLLYGAVGALSGVANPVAAACKLVEDQKKGPLPFGRIRPSVLVGKGAQTFCQENAFDTNVNLITTNAFKTYNRYKRKYQAAVLGNGKKIKLETENQNHQSLEKDQQPSQSLTSNVGIQDTVGAVCVDSEGNMAAAASSGGIWLKSSGRLGPAAMYGAGCWAQNQVSENKPGVAAVTSGCGEHLIQTLLAKTCSDAVRSTDNFSQGLVDSFRKEFIGSEFLAFQAQRYGGALVLRHITSQTDKEVEVAWIHSTASMCLAYMGGNMTAPTVVMSYLDSGCVPGQSYTMGGHVARSPPPPPNLLLSS